MGNHWVENFYNYAKNKGVSIDEIKEYLDGISIDTFLVEHNKGLEFMAIVNILVREKEKHENKNMEKNNKIFIEGLDEYYQLQLEYWKNMIKTPSILSALDEKFNCDM